MKKVVLALAMLCSTAFAQPTSISAKAALVLDAGTGEVLFTKNNTQVRSIASITKLMTAYVTVEANLPLDEQLSITTEDAAVTKLRGGLTGLSLPVGTVLSREQLLHLALMNSQNRAAAALGRTYPGGIEAFVQAMNDTAAKLGMVNTHYVDPTGLYNENKSTADDLALLVKAASKHSLIRDFSTSSSLELTEHHRLFGSTDRLVHGGKWGIQLQKTGFINDAGHCVVMLTSVSARDIVIVLLGEANNQIRARDAISLMFWLQHDHPPSQRELSQVDPLPTRIMKRVRKHRHR